MVEATYWLALGREGVSGYYAQSVIHLPAWRDSAMRDATIPVIIEVTVDPKRGRLAAAIIKNEGSGRGIMPVGSTLPKGD